MKIITKCVVDLETGRIIQEESYEYSGPVALCDRSLGKQAQGNLTNVSNTASANQGEASTAYGSMMPTLQKFTNNPPGYGAMGMGALQNAAEQAAAGNTAAGHERANLQATRTGNVAGLTNANTALSEASSRGLTGALQHALFGNEQMKARQQEEGLRELQGLFGTASRTGAQYSSMVPNAIKATIAANSAKPAWMSNIENILGLAGQVGAAALPFAGMMGGATRAFNPGPVASLPLSGMNSAVMSLPG